MEEKTFTRLSDMLDSLSQAVLITKGLTKRDLEANRVLRTSLERELEIVGEAAKYISEAFRAANPQIPWKRMAGLRDIIVHGYSNLDINMLIHIAQNDAPNVVTELTLILEKEN